MRKLLLLLAVGALFMATSCSKETAVTAKLTWTDDENLDLTSGWKISIYKGALNFISSADYAQEAIQTNNINVNDATASFSVTCDDSYENFTIVAFNDNNSNGKFDSGENAAVVFDMVERGEDAEMKLEIEY
jgi:uncharacterized protein (DUF2141 family)